MKAIFPFIFVGLGLNGWSQDSIEKHQDFRLNFTTSGLGSNIGSMQPTFNISGTEYIYTYEQNSYYGKKTIQPDTICVGKVRITSIDSIINLVKNLSDTAIYEIEVVMSGVVQSIGIKTSSINQRFRMDNTTHPVAEKIIDILNANLPADKPRLWLFGYEKNSDSKNINYTR